MIEERYNDIYSKERELYDKSTQEKLDNAEYFKNEGRIDQHLYKVTNTSKRKITRSLHIFIRKH